MNQRQILELRTEYGRAVDAMQAMHAKAEAEGRGFNAEEQAEWDNADAELEKLKKRIVTAERALEIVSEAASSMGRRSAGAAPAPGELLGDEDDDADDEAEKVKREQDAKFQRALANVIGRYLRGGVDALNPRQREILQRSRSPLDNAALRDLSLTGASGGYTVAQAFYNQLVEAQKAFGGMREAATVFPTSTGATLPVPTESDVANAAAIVGEGVQGNTSVDATFGATNLGAYTYRTLVKVSIELQQDSAFDLESYIRRKMATRFWRGMNAHFTTGTGSGQPTGITAASGGAAAGKTGATGQTTTIIYDDLVDLEHSVDPLYRKQARFMMADSSLKVIKKIKDSQARPIWMPDYATSLGGGFPATLLGYPYSVNQDMPAMAANAKSVAFGDFSYYFIREVMGLLILRLVERYADFGQVGFIGFMRADGKYINVNDPIKLYVNSAT